MQQSEPDLISIAGFRANYELLYQKFQGASAQEFDAYEMDNILSFSLSGQLSFICLMNTLRSRIVSQGPHVRGGWKPLQKQHNVLSDYLLQKVCDVRLVRKPLLNSLWEQKTGKPGIVGFMVGNNIHCIQQKMYRRPEPFSLENRLTEAMNRCHNAEILAGTDFVPCVVDETFVIPTQAMAVECKLIRQASGLFSKGHDLIVTTAADPELSGFEAWLRDVISGIDECVISGCKTLHLVYPSPSGVTGVRQFRGLGAAIQTILQPYRMLFEKIFIHPDMASPQEDADFATIGKTLSFIPKQLAQLYEKFGSKARAGICIPHLNQGRVACPDCTRHRYIYALHADSVDSLARCCPQLRDLLSEARFVHAKDRQQAREKDNITPQLDCALRPCRLDSERHRELGLFATHPVPCDHGDFCFLQACQRAHPAPTLAPLCDHGIACPALHADTMDALRHRAEHHHASYPRCSDPACSNCSESHLNWVVHDVLFRERCPFGVKCANKFGIEHARRWWHFEQQQLKIAGPEAPWPEPLPPGLVEAHESPVEKPSAAVIAEMRRLQQLPVFLTLTNQQLIGLTYAMRFMTSGEIEEGRWWQMASPPTIGECVALIQNGATKPTTVEWLELFSKQPLPESEQPPAQPVDPVSNGGSTQPLKSNQSFGRLDNGSINMSLEDLTQARAAQDKMKFLLHNLELTPRELQLLQETMEHALVPWVTELKERKCVQLFGKQLSELTKERLVKNGELLDIKGLWRESAGVIYQALIRVPELSRFDLIAMTKYHVDASGIVRTVLMDEFEPSINPSQLPHFFKANEEYHASGAPKTLTLTYAHVITQFYSAALSYALYLQDCQHEFNEQRKMTTPPLRRQTSCSQVCLNKPEQKIMLSAGKPLSEQSAECILQLSSTLLATPQSKVLYNGQSYSFIDEEQIMELAKLTMQERPEQLDIELNTTHIQDFLQTQVIRATILTDVDNYHHYANDLYRRLSTVTGYVPVNVIVNQTQQVSSTPVLETAVGASFKTQNLIQLPFTLRSDLVLEFSLTYSSAITWNIGNTVFTIQRFVCSYGEMSTPLLSPREATRVGVVPFTIQVSASGATTSLVLSPRHSLIDMPPCVVPVLDMNYPQIQVSAQGDGIYYLRKTITSANDGYGLRYKKASNAPSKQANNQFAILQIVEALKKGSIDISAHVQMVEKAAPGLQLSDITVEHLEASPDLVAVLYSIGATQDAF